ncbi:cysteine and glycine-rich protein 1-like [Porites lutea]
MPLKIPQAARCPRCNDRVYAAEEVMGAGSKWHKKCFSCKDCKKKLDSTNCSDNNGEIYCKTCHGKNFGTKGYGYGGGAGALTRTQ